MENDQIDNFKIILEIKRYSNQTIASYISHLKMVYVFFNNKSFQFIKDKDLFDYIYNLVNTKKISASTQRQVVGSLKLFYKEIYNREIPFHYLKVSQRENRIPVVLSKNEVKLIIDSAYNIKHKAILALLYGSGLRIGELLNLKIKDIDSHRMTVYIQQAKGKKDRYSVLSPQVLELLRAYFKKYAPKEYLFEGQNGGKYTAGSSAKVFKQVLLRSRIKKRATLHTLRHSFATHLLEDGIGIAHIQKLLGHNSIKTTLIYTHIANDSLLSIKSPFETL
jgi:integrase/recombinase XerD